MMRGLDISGEYSRKGTARQTVPAWVKRINTIEKHEVIATALEELTQGLERLFGEKPTTVLSGIDLADKLASQDPGIWMGTWAGNSLLADTFSESERAAVQGEGFVIHEDEELGRLFIGAETPQGVLYGTFHLLRELVLAQGVQVRLIHLRINGVM